jgi:PAS domain-containing protein
MLMGTNPVFSNQSLENIFEYLPQELTGSSLTLLMPERYKNDYLEELESSKKVENID